MRSRLALALAATAAAFAAPATQVPGPAPITHAAAPTQSTVQQGTRTVKDTAPPAGVQTLQAIDLAFTGRKLPRYGRQMEPIWIGYERPRRHWGGGYWRAKA